jgi:hypothetical protein
MVAESCTTKRILGWLKPYLVGGFNHVEILVNGKDYPIYIMDIEKCSKPPTSISYWIHGKKRQVT